MLPVTIKTSRSATLVIRSVLLVPLFKRLKLGAVLGYLAAGMLIGPWGLGLIGGAHDVGGAGEAGNAVVETLEFAEFGVVMMLFLVGLELEPALLWKMRARLLGLGGLQLLVTTAVVMTVALLLGLPWTVALAVGLVLSVSSTAIVLQTLNEKGLLKSDGG